MDDYDSSTTSPPSFSLTSDSPILPLCPLPSSLHRRISSLPSCGRSVRRLKSHERCQTSSRRTNNCCPGPRISSSSSSIGYSSCSVSSSCRKPSFVASLIATLHFIFISSPSFPPALSLSLPQHTPWQRKQKPQRNKPPLKEKDEVSRPSLSHPRYPLPDPSLSRRSYNPNPVRPHLISQVLSPSSIRHSFVTPSSPPSLAPHS